MTKTTAGLITPKKSRAGSIFALPPRPMPRIGANAILKERHTGAVAPLTWAGVMLVSKVKDLCLSLYHSGLLLNMSVRFRRSGESRRSRAPDSTAASRMRS